MTKKEKLLRYWNNITSEYVYINLYDVSSVIKLKDDLLYDKNLKLEEATGLKDVSNQEIYKNDILHGVQNLNGANKQRYFLVSENEGVFEAIDFTSELLDFYILSDVLDSPCMYSVWLKGLKVVGNINKLPIELKE